MCATGKRMFLLFVLLSSFASAQDEPDANDAPAIFQNREHFYNAISTGNLTVTWSATPKEIAADGELSLTLTVANAQNPQRIRRPNLRSIPAFVERFREIVDVPDEMPNTVANFRYRLRPRRSGEIEIPGLRFDYFHPNTPEGREISTKYAIAISVMVREAVIPVSPAVPRPAAPDRFLVWPSGISERTSFSSGPSALAWLAAIAAIAILTVGWVRLWRVRNPDGVRLANLRRNRAARLALDGLARAGRAPEPAALVAKHLRDFLADRHDFHNLGTVPMDIERELRTAKVPEAKIANAVKLFRACDEARFGLRIGDAARLVTTAQNIILNWEEPV